MLALAGADLRLLEGGRGVSVSRSHVSRRSAYEPGARGSIYVVIYRNICHGHSVEGGGGSKTPPPWYGASWDP